MRKCLFIIGCLLLLIGGCQSKETISNDSKVNELISHYQNIDKYDIDFKVNFIKKDQPLEFKGKKNPEWSVNIFADYEERNVNKDTVSRVPLEVFYDLGLTHSLKYETDVSRDGNTGVLTVNLKEDVQILSEDGHSTIPLYEMGNWGLLNEFYVVQYHDLATGKLLEKPKIHIYRVDHSDDEIKAPVVNYRIDKDGALVLNWNKVEKAANYYVVSFNYSFFKGIDGEWQADFLPLKIYKTSDTSFNSLSTADEFFCNREFVDIYKDTEDDIYERVANGGSIADAIDEDVPILSSIAVIAENNGIYSAISNQIDFNDFIGNLPTSIADFTWNNDFNHLEYGPAYFNSIAELPSGIPITMVDGSTKLIPYTVFEDEITIEESYRNMFLTIPYQVNGTPFKDSFKILNYDNYEVELAELIAQTRSLIASGSYSIAFENVLDVELASKKISSTVPKVEDEIFSTNALSYYIAANLIDNADIIDLNQFAEANDRSYVSAAIMEAFYQNPTIPYIKDVKISANGRYLEIEYADDLDTRLRKQEEIRTKLNDVYSRIINDSMSDIEKLQAINDYIVQHGEYDFDTLAKLETKDKDFDENNYNSFSVYGIGVLEYGVCISYAYTFDYLATKAGLESIVVTGNTNGNYDVGHAWNAVKIDGEWKYFDPTWNDVGKTDQYFNLYADDPFIAKDHLLDNEYIVPLYIEEYR